MTRSNGMFGVVLLLAVLISYGSLYPFDFLWHTLSWSEFLAFLFTPDQQTTRGDIVGNVVLFLPYGFAVALSLQGRRAWLGSAFWLGSLGFLLALALQIAQFWVPERVPAIGDAWLNLAGIAIGLVIGRQLSHVAHRRMLKGDYGQLHLSIPLLLILFWLAYRWFPFVPTLDLQNIKDAVKPLLKYPSFEPVGIFHDAMAWLVCFRLVKRTPARRLSGMTLSLLALSVLVAEPLFRHNYLSLTNALGLGLAILALPLLSLRAAPALLCLGLFLAVGLSGLMPFHWAEPANEFRWLPFAGFLDGSMWINSQSLMEKSFFYGSLVFLLHDAGSRWRLAGITVAIWLALIEFAQIFLVGRTPEITDPLLAVLIAFAMGLSTGHDRHQASQIRSL